MLSVTFGAAGATYEVSVSKNAVKDAAKEAAEESVKSYKKSLKEKRTYVKTGNEYTLSIYDKDGKLQSRVTYKRMSK